MKAISSKLLPFCSVAGALLFAMAGSSMVRAGEPAWPISNGKAYDQAYHDRLLDMARSTEDPLTKEQLQQLKDLLHDKGWPTFQVAGLDGINAAERLLRRATGDADFQDVVLAALDDQVDIDINPLGYARLSDDVQNRRDGTQRYGTLMSQAGSKVSLKPALVENGRVRFFRDFYGLPSLQDQMTEVQEKIDHGAMLTQVFPVPVFAMAPRAYSQPELRKQLAEMIDQDQSARQKVMEAPAGGRATLDAALGAVDRANLKRLREIFKRHGFPTIDMVGRDGVSSAFLLVQHADSDPRFQREALKLAEPLMEKRELSRQQFAMLTDRVLLAEGKQQLYGTQAKVHEGRAVTLPVSDPDELDRRRSRMAMGTEAAYLRLLEEQDRRAHANP